METLKDRVIEALENVIDPELGIDIMNLGLVYDVKMSDDNKHAIVDMTLTSMGCPLAPIIIEQVETAMLGVDEIEKVDVNLVWEPAWTKDKMSRYAKIALGVIDYEQNINTKSNFKIKFKKDFEVAFLLLKKSYIDEYEKFIKKQLLQQNEIY